MTSIQRRLLVSVITYLLAWDAFNHVRDYGLEQIAHSVVRHGVQTTDDERREDSDQFISQIWSSEGELLYASIDDGEPPRRPKGFNVADWHDATWRTYTLTERGFTIQVAYSAARRTRTFAEIVPWLLIPLAALIVGLSLFIGAAVKRALAPLDRVRREVEQQGAMHLQAIASGAMPCVVDDGPGIPDSERDAVFQRFHRLAGAEIPGSGLGLSIARRIVTLQGGHIKLGGAQPRGLSVRAYLPVDASAG